MSMEVLHNGKTFWCIVDADSTNRIVQAISMCHEEHTAEEAREAERKACQSYRDDLNKPS